MRPIQWVSVMLTALMLTAAQHIKSPWMMLMINFLPCTSSCAVDVVLFVSSQILKCNRWFVCRVAISTLEHNLSFASHFDIHVECFLDCASMMTEPHQRTTCAKSRNSIMHYSVRLSATRERTGAAYMWDQNEWMINFGSLDHFEFIKIRQICPSSHSHELCEEILDEESTSKLVRISALISSAGTVTWIQYTAPSEEPLIFFNEIYIPREWHTKSVQSQR